MKKTSEMSKKPTKNGGFTTGLILGGLIGIGSMFMYGTKKGSKLRRHLAAQLKKVDTHKLVDSTKNTLEQTLSQTSKAIDNLAVTTNLATKEVTNQKDQIIKAAKSPLKRLAAVKHYFTKKGKSLK